VRRVAESAMRQTLLSKDNPADVINVALEALRGANQGTGKTGNGVILFRKSPGRTTLTGARLGRGQPGR
jgi:hypothetical protein